MIPVKKTERFNRTWLCRLAKDKTASLQLQLWLSFLFLIIILWAASLHWNLTSRKPQADRGTLQTDLAHLKHQLHTLWLLAFPLPYDFLVTLPRPQISTINLNTYPYQLATCKKEFSGCRYAVHTNPIPLENGALWVNKQVQVSKMSFGGLKEINSSVSSFSLLWGIYHSVEKVVIKKTQLQKAAE